MPTWLSRTPVHTFILIPIIVGGAEAMLHNGSPAFVPWGLPFMIWGFLQYKLVGLYRHPIAGGSHGMEVPPNVLVTSGPYRIIRNPMYLGHLIFLLGLATTLWSLFALVLLLLRAFWFDARVRRDEARLLSMFGAEYAQYCARVNRWIPVIL